MQDLKQSTAVTVKFGPFLDETDGKTSETGLTIAQADVRVSKNGGNYAQKNDAGVAAHDELGEYDVALDATDTGTLGRLKVLVHKAGALPVWEVFDVIPANVWDSRYSTDKLQVDVTQCGGSAVAAGAIPNAAADAAGGLPISDAGGLDLDNRMPAAAAVTNINTLYDGVEGFGTAYAGPRGPGVYLNDAAANTNTANGVDGTWANPVSTIAAAKTIADSLGVDRIYLMNDSAITLVATMEDYEFVGIGEVTANVITLGSQDVDNSHFENVRITGTQGGTGRFQAVRCVLDTIASLEVTAWGCLIMGTLTARNDCAFVGGGSTVAGTGTPVFDVNSVANLNVYFRHYAGGLQVNNAVSTTVMSFGSDGQIIIDATCTGLVIVVYGDCTITDNGTATVLTREAAISRTAIKAEADAALANYDGPTKTEMDAAHALLATQAKQDIIDTNVDTLLVRITSTIFTGITSLAEWLGLIAGKQVGDATALTEIKATGAGSGAYDPTTDANEALRDTAPMGTVMRGTEGANTTTPPTVGAIADAVHDEALSGHVGAGSAGKKLGDIPTTPMRGTEDAALDATVAKEATLGAPVGADLSADIAAVQAKVALLPESAAKNVQLVYVILMKDSTTEDPKAGLSITAQRSIDGGALASMTGTVAEISNGLYKVTASAADMNGDNVVHRFTAAGAKDLIVEAFTTV